MSKNVLLISADILKERTAIHTNIDDKLIFPTIKVCQDMFIHPLLGSALYNKIIDEVDAATIAGNYKDLLDDYIIDCLCWYVVSKLPMTLIYQFWNKGVMKKSGDNSETISLEESEAVRNEYRVQAEWYGERLKNYLIANSTTSFLPEYFNGNNDTDDINPTGQAFTMPIYLGPQYEYIHPDKNNCHCNGEQ